MVRPAQDVVSVSILVPVHVTSCEPRLSVPGIHTLLLLLELVVDDELPQLRVHSVHDDQIRHVGVVDAITRRYQKL